MRTERAAAALALALLLVLAPATAEAKVSGYVSPGYKKPKTSFGKNLTETPLPAITLGAGKNPNLLVDASGTAHAVYTQDGGADAPDTVVSCLLQRGQKQCGAGQGGLAPVNQPGGTPGPFEGNFPGGNHDTDGAVPLNIGNELYVVQRRFPNVVTAPDGTSQQSNAFLWSSNDGGASLTGPGLIGDNQMAGGAIAFGGASPTIGTLSLDQTDGTWFQASLVGTYVRERAWLGRPPFIHDGSAALDGDTPIVAFSDAAGTIAVRRYSGQGSLNDSPNWSQANFPGFDPKIVGGPAGVFVMYRDADGGSLLLRRVSGGVPAPTGTKIAGNLAQATLTETPAGQFALAFVDTTGIRFMTSSSGTTWSTPTLIAKIPDGETVGRLAAAATGDGGGFVSYVKNPVGAEGVGEVALSAFGTQRANGNAGLGPLPGGGIGSAVGDQLATTTCTTAKYGAVVAEAAGGSCYGRDPANRNMAVSFGEVNLNGLRIIPDPGVRIGIDPKAHTIDTTGPVRVVLSAAGLDITLWHAPIHVQSPTAEAGTDLFDFAPPKPPDVAGFPLTGSIDVKLTKDNGVSIPISLGLPKVFGGVTGSATLTATLRGGLQLDSLEFKVPNANFKAIAIKDLDIAYMRQGTVWSGKGTIQVPAGGGVFTLSVDVEFAGGEFQKGSIDLGLPYPGIPIDPTPQLYFTGGGLELGLSPLSITGKANFGLTPLKPPGTGGQRDYVFGLDGQLNATFGDPITLTATVQGYLQSLQIGNAKLQYQLPSRVTLNGEAGFNLGIIEVAGQIGAVFDPKANDYAARIASQLKLHLGGIGIPDPITIPGFSVAVNKRGFAVYIPFGTTPFFVGTIAYNWGDTFPTPFPARDVTGRYTAGIPGARRSDGARAAQANTAFEVPRGAEAVSVQVTGEGGAPSVVLTDPSGKQITPTQTVDKTTPAFAFSQPGTSTTFVGLQKPAAGRWTVTQAPGSVAAVTGVSSSAQTGAPTVKGRVGGKGRARTVAYTATLPAGTTAKLAEKTDTLLHVIGTVKGSKGTIKFTPADAPAGKRQIVALIESEGLPQAQPVLATYAAPGPAVPGRAKSVKVSSSKKAFTVAWTAPPGAYRTLVAITASDGRRIQRIVTTKTRKLSVPVIGFKDAISATVTGLSQTGKKGPAVRAKAARKT